MVEKLPHLKRIILRSVARPKPICQPYKYKQLSDPFISIISSPKFPSLTSPVITVAVITLPVFTMNDNNQDWQLSEDVRSQVHKFTCVDVLMFAHKFTSSHVLTSWCLPLGVWHVTEVPKVGWDASHWRVRCWSRYLAGCTSVPT